MWSLSVRSALGLLLGGPRRPPQAPAGPRGYWWGHDTVEEKEYRKRLEEDRKLVRWTRPGKDMQEKQPYVYAPARIQDEAATLGTNRPLITFNKPELFDWLRRPRLPFTDYGYHVQKQMKDRYRALVQSQIFIKERVQALGPDLAAAHFLLHRNCRVRFKGHDHWTELDTYRKTDLPTAYQPGWYVEAVDAAESELVYEGLQNVRNLVFLRYLDLSYCPHVDAWCLDRISGEYKDSLEYLDLSGCPGVNWSGLECLWRLRRLKTLVLYDLEHVQDLKLLCVLLLEVFPHLDIRGVDYIDVDLLTAAGHGGLLADLERAEHHGVALPMPEEDDHDAKDNVSSAHLDGGVKADKAESGADTDAAVPPPRNGGRDDSKAESSPRAAERRKSEKKKQAES